MNLGTFEVFDNKVIIRIKTRICETPEELLTSDLFLHILRTCLSRLSAQHSYLLGIFDNNKPTERNVQILIKTLLFLTKMKGDLVPKVVKRSNVFFKDKALFNEFVEYLYNFWRSFDRFIICDSQEENIEARPYRIFNSTIEHLTHLIRATYRDIQENITGTHPKIYRQVPAGAEVAAIADCREIPFRAPEYQKLNKIPIIRQVLMYPPLILNPPMNKRTGVFERIEKNPLAKLIINKNDWLGYPAKVGPLTILIYFHKKFSGLGYSLCNLFELAEERDLQKRPDAVYCFGVPRSELENLGESLTLFYDDERHHMMVAAVPHDDQFGYFGYLKKMVLTLHNIIMMKQGHFPFHGALVTVMLAKNKKATILIVGDTGAGKSETLEALREAGKNEIQDMIIIADDMGSMQITKEGMLLGYGTEIGAFLRLDDLNPGYAFGQIDRAIIMSPNKKNARIVLPVTTFDRIMAGHRIDFILYANNYEQIDAEHPMIERFDNSEQALNTFREGTVMSKGTTSSTGLVHSYFANIFGPPQYKELHEKLAQKYFKKIYDQGIFVGQMRTRLGIPGFERQGPEEAARELLRVIQRS